jgi:hypothetical protein
VASLAIKPHHQALFQTVALRTSVPDRPDHLHVRARIAGDLERTFPGAVVRETPEGDYRFRTDVPRAEFGRMIAGRLPAIGYPNFKGSVVEDARHDAYTDAWS